MPSHQIPVGPHAIADNAQADALRDDHTREVASDLAYRQLMIVNVVFFGAPGAGDRNWVLIDAGLFGTKGLIQRAAASRFGGHARPSGIVLTHGHFDHVGVLEELAQEWDTPVYAHELERPFLDGSTSYPPPDPSVGGGLVAATSPLFPRGPVNVGNRLQALPADGSVPGMPGWRWIATPGHTPGHVSLWRESVRTLIAGDAFITTRQESAYSAIAQTPEIHGPPMYFTPDWTSAAESVRKLAALEPDLVVTGHGMAMKGPEMRGSLHRLADEFETIAVPASD